MRVDVKGIVCSFGIVQGVVFFFFFSSRRRHTRCSRDWSSDVCSSDLGDGPQAKSHYPLPADLTDPKLLRNVTDGEIFYQISQGRRPMPSFKNRLTQDQRWQLVLLVRSFSQPASSAGTPAAPTPSKKIG